LVLKLRRLLLGALEFFHGFGKLPVRLGKLLFLGLHCGFQFSQTGRKLRRLSLRLHLDVVQLRPQAGNFLVFGVPDGGHLPVFFLKFRMKVPFRLQLDFPQALA
jgi:hypothetical protein